MSLLHIHMSLYLFSRWHGLQCTVKGKLLLNTFALCFISKSHMSKLPFCLLSSCVRSHHLKGRGLLNPYQSQHLLKLHLVLHPALLCHLPLMKQDLLLLFHPLRESDKWMTVWRLHHGIVRRLFYFYLCSTVMDIAAKQFVGPSLLL